MIMVMSETNKVNRERKRGHRETAVKTEKGGERCKRKGEGNGEIERERRRGKACREKEQ
jgi:hypothetical protein